MKSLFAFSFAVIATIAVGSSAHAEVRTPVKSIQSVNFDGNKLTVGYQTGGGCADHHGDIQLDFDGSSNKVTVQVFDVASEEDLCQAFLYLQATTSLKDKVKTLLKDKGLTLGQVTLVLPQITVSTY